MSEFRQIYCAQNGIAREQYAEHFLLKALPVHARAFRSLLLLTRQNQDHFRSDFDFLNDVGSLRSYRDYRQSVEQFIGHPWNQRTVLRWILRLRVSTTRVRRIVRDQLKAQPAPQSAVKPEPQTSRVAATEGILSDRQKADIQSRLELISTAASPASASKPSPTRTLRSITTTGAYRSTIDSTTTHDRTCIAPPPSEKQKLAAVTDELNVLRVINERLKMDLAKTTAQRDILKQAAAILAGP